MDRGTLRRLAFQLIAYGLPAWLLSTFLQRLSGSALWIPTPWRRTIFVLILGAGMACFQLARRHRAKLARSGSSSPSKVQSAPVRILLAPAGAILELPLEDRPRSAQRHAHARSTQDEGRGSWLSLTYWLVMFVLLIPQLFLRFHCVVPWNPDAVFIHTEYGNPADLSAVPPPAQLEASESGFRGSILVPPRCLLSEKMIWRIDQRSEPYGPSGIQVFLDEEPIELIESLRGESRALWITVVLILIVHLGILLAASTAYGYSFSLIEELGQFIPGFGGA